MRKILLLVISFSLFGSGAFSQSQFMLYQLNHRLPQSNLVNPSFFPDYKVTVGLPVLSATYLTANSGNVSFNNAFTRTNDDSLRFDPQKLASELDEKNRIDVNGNTSLFSLGLKLKRNYFSVSMNQRVDAGLVYPRSIFEFLGTGTGDGYKMFSFDNFGLQGQWYNELAFGYGRQISNKLNVGARIKVLSGVAGLSLDNVSAKFISSTDSLHIHTSEINIYTSGLDLLEANGTDNIFSSAVAFNNTGYAFDFGANYRISDNLTVSVSVTDLGSIKWKNDTRLIKISEVKYSYKGADFLDVIGGNTNFDLFGELADTLGVLYEADTIENVEYTTNLSPKAYAGVSYDLGKMHSFGFLLYGDVFKGTFNPGVGLSYNLTLGHIWTIGVNASYRNKSFSNFGVGTTLTLGPIQIYALSENVSAFTETADATYVDARVGVNLVFGKIKDSDQIKKQKKNKQKKKEKPIPVIDMGK